eukprot:CAMPEP_0197551080 /NCGR_PEP_ID=MMETSP1320-20131121/4458_1 /TAXON_ID=91990 /ORGANISM="Bolidomonas sp., Strain RCC2347" /LENGTH=590 /DNA_ID=CAMNT_0043111525 /DNA_START=109 /DNA_END=1888 /DNA_ORIENTATION=+
MKYGKSLRLARRPGWEDAYVNYSELKAILAQIEDIWSRCDVTLFDEDDHPADDDIDEADDDAELQQLHPGTDWIQTFRASPKRTVLPQSSASLNWPYSGSRTPSPSNLPPNLLNSALTSTTVTNNTTANTSTSSSTFPSGSHRRTRSAYHRLSLIFRLHAPGPNGRQPLPPAHRAADLKVRHLAERFLGLLQSEIEKVSLFALSRVGELSDTIGALRFGDGLMAASSDPDFSNQRRRFPSESDDDGLDDESDDESDASSESSESGGLSRSSPTLAPLPPPSTHQTTTKQLLYKIKLLLAQPGRLSPDIGPVSLPLNQINRSQSPHRALLVTHLEHQDAWTPAPQLFRPFVDPTWRRSSLDASDSETFQANIHIKILKPQNNSLIDTQNALDALFSNPSDQKIDFSSVNDPHVTLYLTTFNTETRSQMFELAKSALQKAYTENCSGSSVDEPYVMKSAVSQYVSGSYGMLVTENSACLQALSDQLVLATQDFVSESAKEYVPSWIYNLPEDQQQQKIELIKQYGSPNVFEGFEPHVTLLVDDVNSTELSVIFQQNEVEEVDSPILEIGFGSVGQFGSVLKNQDLAAPVRFD